MGRKKGVPNRRSQMLLRKLEDDNKFFVVNELIEIYGYDKKVLVATAVKISDNLEAGLVATAGMEEEEVEIYNAANKNATSILVRLLAYLYPKLKATEISSGSGDKVVFNINTLPEVSSEKKQQHPPAQVVPIK